MQSPKKEIQPKHEKREVALVKEKPEEGRHIKCVGCNKTLVIGSVVMGRSLIECGTCGTKNQIDRQTIKGRRFN